MSNQDLEEGDSFTPRLDAGGLIGAIVTDAVSGEVLMFAYMNATALERTMTSGLATFYSRSRNALWVKGETSGDFLRVVEIRTDCDQDMLWLRVRPEGKGACHTGRRSCFYRRLEPCPGGGVRLAMVDEEPANSRS